jgi:hypothetical protein
VAVRSKETQLARVERQLVQRRELLQKTAERWRDVCQEPVQYEAAKQQLEHRSRSLRRQESLCRKRQTELQALKAAYEAKCQQLQQKVEELQAQTATWTQTCEARTAEYERTRSEIAAKTAELEAKERAAIARRDQFPKREQTLLAEKQRAAECEKQLVMQTKEVAQLAEEYKAEEQKIISGFDRIKTRHLKTFGKKKLLLLREQELHLAEIKVAQRKKELERKATDLEARARTLDRLDAQLVEREVAVTASEAQLGPAKEQTAEAMAGLRKQEQELRAREAKFAARPGLDQEVEIKLLGLEMSAQALKKKKQFNIRTLENEKVKLQEKANELKLKEEELLNGAQRTRHPPTRTPSNKENHALNTALDDALAL